MVGGTSPAQVALRRAIALALDTALFTGLATGELTYRNAGAGQRLWTLPRALPARCQAAQGWAVRRGVRVL